MLDRFLIKYLKYAYYRRLNSYSVVPLGVGPGFHHRWMETANSRLTPAAAAAAALDESPAGGSEMQQPRLQQQQHQLQQQNQQQHQQQQQQQGRDSLYQQDINTQGAEGSYPNLDRSELDGNSANLLMMNVAHSLSQSGITCSDVLDAIKASAGVMDTSDEHTYGMSLNGRLSPPAQAQCYGNTYATLTPLQPLPPISTVAEKFGGIPGSCAMPGGGFVFMQQNDLNLAGAAYGTNAYAYKSYPKESTIQTSVTNRASYSAMEVISSAAMVNANTYGQQQIQRNICSSPYSMQFGHHSDMMSSVKSEQSGQDGLIAAQSSYGTYATSLVSSSSLPIKNLQQSMAPIGLNIGMSLVPSHLGQHQSTIASHSQGDLSPAQDQPSSSTDMQDDMSCSEKEEINTREIALKVSNELKKYSIPQAVFAQRVLGRSQGTLSDLLRNPKPWSKLKSGRETFRRMWKWLQEPEYQRMSQLRVMSGEFSIFW